MAAMFVNGSGQNQQSLQKAFHICFLQKFGSFGKVGSKEKIFRNRPIRNKNYLWRPCLLMDRDEMSNLYRGPSIDASYQVSVHLAKRFQRRIFLETTNQKQKLPVAACLSMVRNEMTSLYRGPPIDDTYQVSVHLAKRFQRRRSFRNQPIRNKNRL